MNLPDSQAAGYYPKNLPSLDGRGLRGGFYKATMQQATWNYIIKP